MLNTANLLTQTHLLQSQYKTSKHLESCLDSFKVTHFVITEKATRDFILLYNNYNAGFRVGNFEGKVLASKILRTPLSFVDPYLGNPCEYSHKRYIYRN